MYVQLVLMLPVYCWIWVVGNSAISSHRWCPRSSVHYYSSLYLCMDFVYTSSSHLILLYAIFLIYIYFTFINFKKKLFISFKFVDDHKFCWLCSIYCKCHVVFTCQKIMIIIILYMITVWLFWNLRVSLMKFFSRWSIKWQQSADKATEI